MSFGIGVGDIIKVSQIAFQLVNSIRAAPDELESLATELESVKHLVNAITERVANNHLPVAIARSAEQHLSRCRLYLQTLDGTTKGYIERCRKKGSHPVTRMKWGTYRRGMCLELMRELWRLVDVLDTLMRYHTSETAHQNNAILRRIEDTIPAAIDNWSDIKPIQFIDAMDRRFLCPIESCQTWEHFKYFLKSAFMDKVGGSWVEAGRYEISNEEGGAIMNSRNWNNSIRSGMILSMAIIFRREQDWARSDEYTCPSCQSPYEGSKSGGVQRVQCLNCSTSIQTSSEPQIMEIDDDGVEPGGLSDQDIEDMSCSIDDLKHFRRLDVRVQIPVQFYSTLSRERSKQWGLYDCIQDCPLGGFGPRGFKRRANFLDHLRGYHEQNIPRGG